MEKIPNENVVNSLAAVLKDPTKLAKLMFKTFFAMTSAGFNEAQALDITKYIMTLVIGAGGLSM